MKIKVTEASRQISIHPLNLLLKVYPLVGDLSDFYPSLEEGLIQTVKQLGTEHRQVPAVPMPPSSAPVEVIGPSPDADFTVAEQKLMEKLWRGEFWGGKRITLESLRNHLCRNIVDFDSALESLINKEIVIARESDGPFSLNPKRKSIIEAVARRSAGQQH